jgi:ribosomal protein S4
MEDKNLVREMANLKLVVSCSEARRLICQGGVRVDGTKILDIDKMVGKGDLIEVGIKAKKSATVT